MKRSALACLAALWLLSGAWLAREWLALRVEAATDEATAQGAG